MVHGNSAPWIYQGPVLADLLLSSPAGSWDGSSFLSFLESCPNAFVQPGMAALGRVSCSCPLGRIGLSGELALVIHSSLLPVYPGIAMGSAGDKGGGEPCCNGTQVTCLVPAVSWLLLFDSLVALMHRGFEQ